MPRPKKMRHEFPRDINVFDDSVSDNYLAHQVLSTLLPREIDVFARLVKGDKSEVISQDLGVAKRTIDLHRHRIMKKLHLRNIAQEAVLGYRIRVMLANWTLTRGFQQQCYDRPRVGDAALTHVDNSGKYTRTY